MVMVLGFPKRSTSIGEVTRAFVARYHQYRQLEGRCIGIDVFNQEHEGMRGYSIKS